MRIARLPVPGSDEGQWGDVLNDYLLQSHTTAGGLKNNVVGPAQLQPGSVTATTIQDGALTETKLATGIQDKLDQAANLAPVATSGSYADLVDTPIIPATAADVGAVASSSADTVVAGLINDSSSATAAAVTAKLPASNGTPLTTAVLKYTGILNVGIGATRLYNDTGTAWTIQSVRATIETAPVSSSVIIDVNINDSTIFSTQANRPAITVSATTSGKITAIDTVTVADGDYLTVDVDETDGTAANLTVTVILA